MHRLDRFPTEDMIAEYRRLASDRRFSGVFVHMLYELGVFEDVVATEEDRALRNYGARLLKILGGGEVNADTMAGLVKNLINQPLKRKKKKDSLLD